MNLRGLIVAFLNAPIQCSKMSIGLALILLNESKLNYSLSFLLSASAAPQIARPEIITAEIPITEPQP